MSNKLIIIYERIIFFYERRMTLSVVCAPVTTLTIITVNIILQNYSTVWIFKIDKTLNSNLDKVNLIDKSHHFWIIKMIGKGSIPLSSFLKSSLLNKFHQNMKIYGINSYYYYHYPHHYQKQLILLQNTTKLFIR